MTLHKIRVNKKTFWRRQALCAARTVGVLQALDFFLNCNFIIIQLIKQHFYYISHHKIAYYQKPNYQRLLTVGGIKWRYFCPNDVKGNTMVIIAIMLESITTGIEGDAAFKRVALFVLSKKSLVQLIYW